MSVLKDTVINGKLVVTGGGALGTGSKSLSISDLVNATTELIYSTTSLSTGSKSVSTAWSTFRYLIFAIQENSNGWRHEIVSRAIFQNDYTSSSSGYTLIYNNPDTYKYLNLYCTGTSTFYLYEYRNLTGFRIYGVY